MGSQVCGNTSEDESECYKKRHIQRCPVLPHTEFWPFLALLPTLLTSHNVKNYGGGCEDGWPQGIAGGRRAKRSGPVGLSAFLGALETFRSEHPPPLLFPPSRRATPPHEHGLWPPLGFQRAFQLNIAGEGVLGSGVLVSRCSGVQVFRCLGV